MIPGKYVITRSTKTKIKKYGTASLNISITPTPPICEIINKLRPIGGVIMPIIRFKTITTPKCTSSTPKPAKRGKRTGAMINIMGSISIIIPKIRRRIFIIKSNIQTSELIANIASVRITPRFSLTASQAKIFDVATVSIMTDVATAA